MRAREAEKANDFGPRVSFQATIKTGKCDKTSSFWAGVYAMFFARMPGWLLQFLVHSFHRSLPSHSFALGCFAGLSMGTKKPSPLLPSLPSRIAPDLDSGLDGSIRNQAWGSKSLKLPQS